MLYVNQVTIALLKLVTATAETAVVESQDKSCGRLTSNDMMSAQSQQDLHIGVVDFEKLHIKMHRCTFSQLRSNSNTSFWMFADTDTNTKALFLRILYSVS